MTDLAAKDGDLASEIVRNVNARCGCGFNLAHITNRVFDCFHSSPQAVIYHVQLHNTPDTSVAELTAHLQDWAASGVSIPIQFLPLFVNDFCVVSSGTPVELCSDEVTTAPMNNSATVTVVVVACIALLIVIIMAFVIVLIVVLKRRRHHASLAIASKK